MYVLYSKRILSVVFYFLYKAYQNVPRQQIKRTRHRARAVESDVGNIGKLKEAIILFYPELFSGKGVMKPNVHGYFHSV